MSLRLSSGEAVDSDAYGRLLAAGDPVGSRPLGQLVERLATAGRLREEQPAPVGQSDGP